MARIGQCGYCFSKQEKWGDQAYEKVKKDEKTNKRYNIFTGRRIHAYPNCPVSELRICE